MLPNKNNITEKREIISHNKEFLESIIETANVIIIEGEI